ncbi:hypothetical protein [Planctomycetes bacterium SV_7m_r]|uniref:hypothetical protein n=1 Tax=Stieleria bergensis TaxID=2528025 RepID=UPI0011A832E3
MGSQHSCGETIRIGPPVPVVRVYKKHGDSAALLDKFSEAKFGVQEPAERWQDFPKKAGG